MRAAGEQTAGDLRRMARLHELSARLESPGDRNAMLDEVLRAAVDLNVAEMGNIQCVDEQGVLAIVAHRGFDRPFLEFFARVDAQIHSACGAAMAQRRRVAVEDVAASPIFAGSPSLLVMRAAGVRAVQSTPLMDRSGRLLGAFSTHYRDAHRFDDAELRWLDMLARHAADVMERHRAAVALGQSRRELEAHLRAAPPQVRALVSHLASAEARDLHDRLAQLVHAARLKVAGLRKEPGPRAAVALLEELDALCTKVEQIARSPVFRRDPPMLAEPQWAAAVTPAQVTALGNREREVLTLLAQGTRSPQIAARLGISPATVEAHRRNIMRKLDLHGVAELTRYAVRARLVDP